MQVENAASSAITAGFEDIMRPDAQLRFSAEDGRAVQLLRQLAKAPALHGACMLRKEMK